MDNVLVGIIIPFLGTCLGSGCVYLLKNNIKDKTQKILIGFASGVMLAASIWSLLIPSIDSSKNIIEVLVGFWLGILLLLGIDNLVPHLHKFSNEVEGLQKKKLKKTTMMLLAVTIHNIPEGMAVGVVYAGYLQNNVGISLSGAVALALGIALQNFPEGAIISLPLKSEGMNKTQAFVYGCLSGIVEPIAAVLTILFSKLIISFLPVLLALAAGAMIYVIVEELIPEMMNGEHSNVAVIAFGIGFSLMMCLDVMLG